MNHLPEITKLVHDNARRFGIGTVGIAGSHARGDTKPGADLDLLVTVALPRAKPFAAALANATRRAVHLHEFARLPWFHPYHLGVIWVNCSKLPVCPCPPRARIRQEAGADGFEVFTHAENIPHFAAVDRPPPTRPGEAAALVLPSSDVLSLEIEKLIGRSFHLARFLQTAGGVYVEPFSRVRLGNHGRAYGDTPMHWSRYGNGFALIRRGELPGISFQRLHRGMPVAYHNLEGYFPHHICLIPEASPPWRRRIYLIASNARFFAKTVPRLVAQLRADGVRNEQIKVVVNGSAEDRDERIGGIEHAFTSHNAWEFSALYEAPRRFEFDAAFMMHDTVRIERGFHLRAWAVPGWLAWDHCPASAFGRCCIGIYSRDYLLRLNSWLQGLDGISKNDAILIELMAEFIQRARAACAYGGEISAWQEVTDEWGTGTRRLRRIFPQLGLHKFTSLDPNLYARLL